MVKKNKELPSLGKIAIITRDEIQRTMEIHVDKEMRLDLAQRTSLES